MIGISYDKETHGVLIRLRPGRYETSEEITPGFVIDFDARGEPIAIEFEDVRGFMNEANLERIVRPRIQKGADLRTFRERLGLTQDALAGMLQLPRNTIARWERDEMEIEKPRLLELALAALTSQSEEPALATAAKTKKER
jgi:DNA-binding XRE family transcriptional regulator